MTSHIRVTLAVAAVACVCAGSALLLGEDRDEFSPWTAPASLGEPVNTIFDEFGASIARDGLTLYFASRRPGGFGGLDIWVSRRASPVDAWGGPVNLGPSINTVDNETVPALSLDGHRLYFASNRPGGWGGSDLYVARRRNSGDALGWRGPENLGAGVNSAANETSPALFNDEATGTTVLYFSSNRLGNATRQDFYESTLLPGDTFSPASRLDELSSEYDDIAPAIRRDGLEVVLTSNRAGTFGGFDLWVSTRPSTASRWSTPLNLGPLFNSPINEGWPALAFDGTVLYFSTGRPGDPGFPFGTVDLYASTRNKARHELPAHGY